MKNSRNNFSTNLWQRFTVLIIALLVIALSPVYAEQPTSGISFAQISFTNPEAPQKYSHYGQVSVDYSMLYGEGYVNVERYENGRAAGWVVKNLPVISGSVLPGFSTMFDLGAPGYQSSFTGYVVFSTKPLADDSSLKNQTPLTYKLGQAEYPVLAPANNNVFSVTLKSPVCNGQPAVTFNNFIPQVYLLPKNISRICVQNRTNRRWVGLTFTDPGRPPTPLVTGRQDENSPWPFDNIVENPLSVDFNGVVKHVGIAIGRDEVVILNADTGGGTVTIAPR